MSRTSVTNSRHGVAKGPRRWPWVAIAAALVAPMAAQCSSRPAPSTSTGAQKTTSTASETPAAPPAAPVAVPTVISLSITLAEEENGIQVDAIDIGEQIGRLVLGRLDGVDTRRALSEKGNWRIVAQCDQMVDKTLKVGVILTHEFMAISQAGQARSLSDNMFKFLLDCPA